LDWFLPTSVRLISTTVSACCVAAQPPDPSPSSRTPQSPDERELSAALQTALEAATDLASFPKATVDIYVLVLEASGGELGAAATAAALALADAGVELFDLVVACTLVRAVPGCCARWGAAT
jgi:exosome complex component MTR3